MDLNIERRAHLLARLLAMLASAVAVMVLVGYFFDVPTLIRIRPHFQAMATLTAAAIALLGVGIVAATLGRQRMLAATIGFVVLIIGIAMVSVMQHGQDIVSPAIALTQFGIPWEASGRMSIGTAVGLLLACVSLVVRKHPFASDLAAGAGMLIAGAVLLGYAYDAEDLHAVPIFSTMAVHTAASIFLLCLASTMVEPRLGWSATLLSSTLGGDVTRRQLGLLLLPAVVGWLLREGTLTHQFGSGTALALLVMLTVAPMALLVLRDGRAQVALDQERRGNAATQASLSRDLEQRLALKTEQLERESLERSRAEAAMYRSQRVEAIGQLTGGIAHDFNNLLAAISGNLELMLRRLPEEHAARRYAVTAATAVGKGAKLAGQLLAFSRSQRLAIQPTEVAPALLRARELIGNALGPSIELIVEFSRDDYWAKTDPDQLDLAILNLAVNAREAMPQGGILHVDSGVRQMTIEGSSVEKTYVSIRVVDDGIGMTPDVLAKAIEPFFTTRERGKGTGLGLAQVYGFVRQCEGDLLIDSTPGRGTTVEMLLPIAERPIGKLPLRETRSSSAGHATGAKRRLLVVDDDDAVRGVLVELLGDAGYDIVEANDGPSALALLDRIRPDAAVIDFLMPGMNGAELARRAQDRHPNLPIVFVSGYSDTVALDGIAGALVLRKPFHDEQLQCAVESAISSGMAMES